MDSRTYFQLVNSHRRGSTIPPNTYRTVGEHYLGYSISNTEPRILQIPQGSLYSPYRLLNTAQAQYFRHLVPRDFVNLQNNGTKYSGG